MSETDRLKITSPAFWRRAERGARMAGGGSAYLCGRSLSLVQVLCGAVAEQGALTQPLRLQPGQIPASS